MKGSAFIVLHIISAQFRHIFLFLCATLVMTPPDMGIKSCSHLTCTKESVFSAACYWCLELLRVKNYLIWCSSVQIKQCNSKEQDWTLEGRERENKRQRPCCPVYVGTHTKNCMIEEKREGV